MYFRILFIFLIIFSTHHYDVMAKSKTRINNYVFTSEDIFTDKTKSYLNETSNSIFQKKKILVFYASYKNNCHLQKSKNVKNKDEFSVPNLRKEMLCLYDFTAKIRSKLLANLPNYADRSVVILFPPAPSESSPALPSAPDSPSPRARAAQLSVFSLLAILFRF